MDEIILRFPTIAQGVFKEIDNESLIKCKEISHLWNNLVDSQKEVWIRRIRLRSEKLKAFPNLWSSVISKTSVERVKELALAVQNVVDQNKFGRDEFTPHHIVAAVGMKELYEYIAYTVI